MIGYKRKINEDWKRICCFLDNGLVPSPFNFQEFQDNVNMLEEMLHESKSLNIDKEWVRKQYLNEIWLSEIPPPKGTNINTGLLVDYVMAGEKETFLKDLSRMAKNYKLDAEKWWSAINNLWSAMKFFDDDSLSLTEEFLCKLHTTLMDGLLENAGTYRTHHVTAWGSSVAYLPHQKIKDRVPILIKFVSNEFNNLSDKNRILKALCLGAFFFSEYLLIHPFSDGNGRVSRLALSILLKDFTIVPVSLYYQGDRDIYLTALEKRGSGMRIPWSVIQYVIDSCLDTAEKVTQNFLNEDY